MPAVDVFVKSYGADLPWLAWCLKSIDRFWDGGPYSETIVAVPPECVDAVRPLLHERQRVVSVRERLAPNPSFDRPPGYLFQQAVKLQADGFCDASQILFLDSDCVVTSPCNADAFREPLTGFPLVHFETYAYFSSRHPGVMAWQPMVSAALKRRVENEYMRCQPSLYWRDSLGRFRRHLQTLHEKDFLDVIEGSPQWGGFSEYNTLGAYLHRDEPHRYRFVQTEYPQTPRPYPVKQFWSYSGITPEIHAELSALFP